jgi:antirestriction protein ArdC
LPCDTLNPASYIVSWVAKPKEDKREIFRAATGAQRIADYLLAFHLDFAAAITVETESGQPIATLVA